MLLIQKVYFEVKDMKECENQVADHIALFENEGKSSKKLEIEDSFLDEQVRATNHDMVQWYTEFKNYVVNEIIIDNLRFHQRKKFLLEEKGIYGMNLICLDVTLTTL